MKKLSALLALVCSSTLLVYCGDGQKYPEGYAEKILNGGAKPVAYDKDKCRASFINYQKDAYRNVPGVSTGWPPHTTTLMTVACESKENAGQFIAVDRLNVENPNWGTKVSDTVDGEPVLVSMNTRILHSSYDNIATLSEKMKTCACPADEMLSLDSFNNMKKEILWNSVEAYMDEHYVIAPNVDTNIGELKTKVRAKLEASDFSGAYGLTTNGGGSWKGDASWQNAVTSSIRKMIEDTGARWDNSHVCNNDAQLQGDLFSRAQKALYMDGLNFETEVAKACNQQSDICKGPRLFYDVKEISEFKASDKAYLEFLEKR